QAHRGRRRAGRDQRRAARRAGTRAVATGRRSAMTTSNTMRKSEVGELRPSKVLTTFGIGSLVDLPNLSVMVMGLESWPDSYSTEIGEERLLLSAQKVLGPQLKRLLAAPRGQETTGAQTNWFDEARQIGRPSAPFPRSLGCSKGPLLGPLRFGAFEAKGTA